MIHNDAEREYTYYSYTAARGATEHHTQEYRVYVALASRLHS